MSKYINGSNKEYDLKTYNKLFFHNLNFWICILNNVSQQKSQSFSVLDISAWLATNKPLH